MKSKFIKFIIALFSVLLISCNTANNEALEQKIDEIGDSQKLLLKKLDTMDKSIKNLALASKNKPADNKQQPPKADPNKVYNIPIGDSFYKGPKDAAVTMIEWSDFQWPHCARSVSLIDQLLKKYPNDLRVVIKQFPLSFHKQARKASLYALAAERQGKYLEMSNKIFENYRGLKSNEDLPREYAEELGLDMAQFDQDMKDPALEARIDKEMNQMKQSGIPRMSVPKFLINGKEPQGGRSLEAFSAAIDAELKNKK